jgi:purine catabolism regulator
MGVSAVQLDPASLQSAFRQAQLALKTAEIFGKDSPVFYWQLGADRLLAELGDSPVLKDMVWSSLGPLLAPTDTNRELLRTLRAFLDCGGNKEKAARSLFIHRTTLLYRLRKIGRLLGRDLRDPSVRLDLQLALRAMDITGGSWREDRR